MMHTIRRHLIAAGAASLFSPSLTHARPEWPIADVHSHLFLNIRDRLPIRERLTQAGVALIAYHIVPDRPYLSRDAATGRVTVKPLDQPGDVYTFFQRMIHNTRNRILSEGLPFVLSASDLAAVSISSPHIILAIEGADFIEKDFSRLEEAYRLGARQIGIAHFIDSSFADIRSAPPRLGGLSPLGRTFIERCNVTGILVDLSHSTDEAIEQACETSRKPMIYSHGSMGLLRAPHSSRDVMSISRSTARKLAQGGGLVGIWGHRNSFSSISQYGDAIARFINWVGEDHLALGSDIGGLGTPSDPIAFDLLKKDYGELRKVIEHLDRSGVPGSAIEKIAFGNYRRVLGEALG
jgi:microsomal dipeptidase-like Zn-dependent dipeptidase